MDGYSADLQILSIEEFRPVIRGMTIGCVVDGVVTRILGLRHN